MNIVVAREAGEALFGDFNVALEGLLIISTLITLGTDSTILYYVPKLYSQKKYTLIHGLLRDIKQFLKPIYLLIISLGMVLSLSILAAVFSIHKFSLFDSNHPLFMFIWGTVFISLYNIVSPYLRAINLMRLSLSIEFIRTAIYFALGLVTYFYLYKPFYNYTPIYFPHLMLTSYILSCFICTIFICLFLKKTNLSQNIKIAKKIKFSWKKKLPGYTLHNFLFYIFSTIPLIMLEVAGTNEKSVGLFAAIDAIVNLAYIGVSPIGIIIEPEISASFIQGKTAAKKTLIKYLFVCFSISLVLLLIFSLFSYQILLLYKNQFIDALPYLRISLINIVLFALGEPLTKFILYSKKGNTYGAKLTLVLLPLQCLASFILIRLFGIKGAVICYIGIYILYDLICAFIVKNIVSRLPNQAKQL